MFSDIYSGALYGIRGRLVNVEADISDGFPTYTLVGYLASEVKEAKERVTTALKNSGYYLPAKKIIINLSPAGVRKQGTAFDLPIALAVLGSLNHIPQQKLEHIFAIGELSLNGKLRPVKGLLPLLIMAREQGITRCFVPSDNEQEARLAEGMDIVALPDLKAACVYFQEGIEEYENYIRTVKLAEMEKNPAAGPMAKSNGASNSVANTASNTASRSASNGASTAVLKSAANAAVVAARPISVPDFADVAGQEALKRAIVVAASGMHHLLMIGPPGSGKSMSAGRIPGIMPPMTFDEQMEVTRLYSVAGLLDENCVLMNQRPYRCPHHTVPVKAMTGGGVMPAPGEISLAHRGILFLDELAEFHPATLEVLRQPLEEGVITINRLGGSFVFPAKFMLVAAMNPCKCGYYPDRNRCRCTSQDVYRYLHRISRPLLDRIDICVDVHPPKDIFNMKKPVLSSADMRRMVSDAMDMQAERFAGNGLCFNSEIPAGDISRYCVLSRNLGKYMNELAKTFGLSARGRHKLLKVARTVADLDKSPLIEAKHLDEAAAYRMIDRTYWDYG